MVRVIRFINKFPANIAIGKTKNKINNIFSKESNLFIKSLLFFIWKNWLRGTDLNRRPQVMSLDELPGCSTPRNN